MTSAVDLGASLEEQCEQIWQATLDEERRLQDLRDEPPVMFVFDGYQRLVHILFDCVKLHAVDVENDTGSIELDLLYTHPVAQWMADVKGRMARGEGENFHIDVEKNGVRLSGRWDQFDIGRDTKGRRTLHVVCLTDYENLKWVDCWSNPFLPFVFQFPRIFIIAGPAIWALKMALFVNLWRINSSIWQIPDDPMNPLHWLDGFDMSTWDVVIKPTTFLADMAAGTTWCLFYGRWDSWHDRAKSILADAELSVVTRRWRTGDPEPWDGAFETGIKDGALVVDIVDKSGQMEGTANGGTIFDGLTRVARDFTTDLIENVDTELEGEVSYPVRMFTDWLGTEKEFPSVHFPADAPGAAETTLSRTPAKGVTLNTGGHSAPGVNEAISAGIQATVDLITSNMNVQGYGLGSLGGSVDAVLKPFYEDTVLAWISAKLTNRIAQAGSSHYYEFRIDSPGKAYTLSSLMVLRQAMVATERKTKKKLEFKNSGPYLIGWPGVGHMYKGDRASFEVIGDTTGEIFVQRAMKTSLDWEADHFAQWEAEMGTSIADPDEDPIARLTRYVASMADAAHQFGVW